jgi:hypothetical protein
MAITIVVSTFACHRSPRAQQDIDVDRDVRNTTREDLNRDSVAVFFRDTSPSSVFSSPGRTFTLQTPRERQALRAIIKKERDLWRSSKPGDYRFLLRVACFCPGTRGWLFIEVRESQPLRAWDTRGRSAAIMDWNTFSIDTLYDNLERSAERDAEVQIAFEPRWHFPTYIRTRAGQVPDGWSIVEARGFRPSKD